MFPLCSADASRGLRALRVERPLRPLPTKKAPPAVSAGGACESVNAKVVNYCFARLALRGLPNSLTLCVSALLRVRYKRGRAFVGSCAVAELPSVIRPPRIERAVALKC